MFPISELIANAEVEYRHELAQRSSHVRTPRRRFLRNRRPAPPEQRKGGSDVA